MFFKRLLTPGNGGEAGNGDENNNKAQQQQQQTSQSPHSSNISPNLPAGVQIMSADMQKKLSSKSIQYNMKVLIRGDRNVGKTQLFRRIQGFDFTEEYVATDEIKVAHITWTYKATDDVVKVEVWDVVDKGKPRQASAGLKLSNAEKQLYSTASLDAEFIDVYKGAHCVIFVFDITKLWTMEYVEREVQRVPPHMPVLFVANRVDQSHHRTVPRDRPRVFAETLMGSRPPGGSPVMTCEASMRNNFGMRFVHSFLGIPFLAMQRNTLAALLERNATELEAMHDELQAMLDDPSQSYEAFSDLMANRRRETADRLSPAVALAAAGQISPNPPTGQLTPNGSNVGSSSRSNSTTSSITVPVSLPPALSSVINSVIGNSPAPAAPPAPAGPPMVAMTGVGRGQPIVVPPAASAPYNHQSASTADANRRVSPQPQTQPVVAAPSVPVTTPAASSSLFSKVFRPGGGAATTQAAEPGVRSSSNKLTTLGSVDDFVPLPTDNIDSVDSFLSDEPAAPPPTSQSKSKSGGFMSLFSSQSKQTAPAPAPTTKQPAPPVSSSSYNPPPPARPAAKRADLDSDDDDNGRPQIAGFAEDIDLDDIETPAINIPNLAHKVSQSDSDDDFTPPAKNSASRPTYAPPPQPQQQSKQQYRHDSSDSDDFLSETAPPSFVPVPSSPNQTSRTSSMVQQPPSPPPQDARSFSFTQQPPSSPSIRSTASSFAQQPPSPPFVASRSTSIAEPPSPYTSLPLVEQQQQQTIGVQIEDIEDRSPSSSLPLPQSSPSSRSSSVLIQQRQQLDPSPRGSENSFHVNNGYVEPLTTASPSPGQIWLDSEEQQIESETLSTVTATGLSAPPPPPPQQDIPTLTDMDFNFLETVSSSKPALQQEVVEVVTATVKKTKKKKDASLVSETSTTTTTTKKSGTKKTTKKQASESEKSSSTASPTKKSGMKKQQSSDVEMVKAPPPVSVKEARANSGGSGSLQMHQRSQPAATVHSPVVDEGDDLEDFLNS